MAKFCQIWSHWPYSSQIKLVQKGQKIDRSSKLSFSSEESEIKFHFCFPGLVLAEIFGTTFDPCSTSCCCCCSSSSSYSCCCCLARTASSRRRRRRQPPAYKLFGNTSLLITLESNLNLESSANSFGVISPIWQNITSLGNFLTVYFFFTKMFSLL